LNIFFPALKHKYIITCVLDHKRFIEMHSFTVNSE